MTGLTGNTIAAPIADGIITFNNNATASGTDGWFTQGTGVWVAGSFIQTGVPLNADFEAGAEFRMVGPDGQVGGGGQKDIVTTTIDWGTGFGGFVISSTGDMTPGCADVPDGCLGITQGGFNNADFFGSPFGFALDPQIPIVANVDLVEGGAFTISASSIQAQWGNVYFPMGLDDPFNEVCNDGSEITANTSGCGFNMSGIISNLGVDGSFDFILRGEHNISPFEDTAGNRFRWLDCTVPNSRLWWRKLRKLPAIYTCSSGYLALWLWLAGADRNSKTQESVISHIPINNNGL